MIPGFWGFCMLLFGAVSFLYCINKFTNEKSWRKLGSKSNQFIHYPWYSNYFFL